jgi:type IX secretion system PorP/SprF family membrane protein
MKQVFSIFLFLLAAYGDLSAQYFQFSQYNFSQQRINPGSVGSSDYASASGLFRNQDTGGNFHLKSNLLNLAYPFINRKNGFRWAGIGLSFMDDKTGQSGIYHSQEISLSYAINVPLAKYQALSVGFKVLHASRKVNVNGLVTDAQYVPDRGFDTGMESGENIDLLNNQFTTFSSGVYWQQEDKKGNKLANFGFSFFDINKPEDNFLEGNNPYPSTIVLSGSFRTYAKDKISLVPDFLFTRNTGLTLATIGMLTRYQLNSFRDKPDDRIDVITRYTINRSGIIGLQLHQGNFSIGFSYDFPVSRASVANAGAFEVGVEIRRLVDPKNRARNKRTAKKAKSSDKEVVKRNSSLPKNNSKQPSDSLKSKTHVEHSEISKRLKQKQDSIHAIASPGDFQHEPLLLEEATLRFGFDFNSSDMDESSSKYLTDLAEALNENPDLKIELTGHTDNVGSAKFNLKLSYERAATIKDELVKRGVSEKRISVFGKGLTVPLNRNLTSQDRSENRRVEMKIFYE